MSVIAETATVHYESPRRRVQPSREGGGVVAGGTEGYRQAQQVKHAVHHEKGSVVRQQEAFVTKVKNSDAFWRVLHRATATLGVTLEQLEGFGEELCRCLWTEAVESVRAEVLLGPASSEVAHLKSQLAKCHASYMRQMESRRGHNSVEEDIVTFHEPLQYLDSDTKELVFWIVSEKIRLLESDAVPNSLMREIWEYLNQKWNSDQHSKRRAQKEQGREKTEDVEALQEDLDDALEKAAELQAQTNALQDEMSKAKAALEATVSRELALQTAHDKLVAEQADAMEELRTESERLKSRLEALESLPSKNSPRTTESAATIATTTVGTLTELTGAKLDAQAAEAKRLRVAIDEMHTKLKDVMDIASKRGYGDEMKGIFGELGLDGLLNEDSVFKRLYKDALARMDRLQVLREKLAQEEKKAKLPEVPRTSEPLHVSAINICEQSPLSPSMLRMVQEIAPTSLSAARPPLLMEVQSPGRPFQRPVPTPLATPPAPTSANASPAAPASWGRPVMDNHSPLLRVARVMSSPAGPRSSMRQSVSLPALPSAAMPRRDSSPMGSRGSVIASRGSPAVRRALWRPT
eukprot:TRINITY_DN10090_c0_g1_i1.p1 TRINITY_DN10090_c0_g1~~TRINITY_DN10090_c0_g1_i1.p1  ORF type:complete len:578 (+),score=106.67 TRINITY_DN10090_c0_g1_i1:148-1881(+)